MKTSLVLAVRATCFSSKFLSLILPCLLFCLQAHSATLPPIASELRSLQGSWEGFLVGNEADGKITLTITGDSLHFHRDTSHWFETTFTLSTDAVPKQLHATIKRSSTPDLIGQVVISIFKIENGALILSGSGDSVEELPKVFEGKGIMRHEFRKDLPRKQSDTIMGPTF
jgi:uncharacterized protein (TIGR03067 family)